MVYTVSPDGARIEITMPSGHAVSVTLERDELVLNCFGFGLPRLLVIPQASNVIRVKPEPAHHRHTQ